MRRWTRQQHYGAGMYKFPPPPVLTASWNDADWMEWINSTGVWLAYCVRALHDIGATRPFDDRRFLYWDRAKEYADYLSRQHGGLFEVITVSVQPREDS